MPKPRAKAEQGSRRRWLFRVAAVVLLVVLPLAVEGALRLFGFGYPTGFLVRKGDFWLPNDRFAAQFFGPGAAARPVYFKVAVQKPTDTVRIVVLGESAAMGTPDPAFSFERILEVMLEGRLAAKKVEMVNAAMRGIDSHVVRRIARDCAALHPDLFIVYMGNNEVVGLHGPEPGCSRLSQSLQVMRAGQWLKSTRVWQAIKKGKGENLKPEGKRQDMEFFRQHRLAPDDWRREGVRRNFAANLEDVIQAAVKAGAQVIVSTVPVNVKDFPPLGSLGGVWDANEEFRVAQRLLVAESTNQARDHFERALDWDALQFRADGKLNEKIREVAMRKVPSSKFQAPNKLQVPIRKSAGSKPTKGVVLVDTVKVFAEAEGGIAGARLFRDHVHPTFEGDYLLARTLLPVVEEMLKDKRSSEDTLKREHQRGEILSREECDRLLAYTVWHDAQIQLAMADLTSRPPYHDQLDYRERQAAAEKAARERLGRLTVAEVEAALEISKAAVKRRPDDWLLRHNCAQLYQALGRPNGAVEHLEAIAKMFPDVESFRLMLEQARLSAERSQRK